MSRRRPFATGGGLDLGPQSFMRNLRTLSLLATLSCVLARDTRAGDDAPDSPGGETAVEWPQWRGPGRDGVSREEVTPEEWPDGKPELLWKASVGAGFSSIAVRHGRAYTLGNDDGKDTIWCFTVVTGKTLWRHAYPSRLGADLHEGGPSSTPVVDRDRLYAMSKWGVVHSLDAATGAVLWKRDLVAEEGVRPNEWGLSGSPLVRGDLVILNAGSAGVALDRRSGKTVWLSGKDSTGYASPLLFRPTPQSDPAVLIFAAKALVAVKPATGAELWRHPWTTGFDNNNADPVILGSRLLITSYDRGAACLEARVDGVDVRWVRRSIKTHMAPPVLVGEHVFGFSGHHARRPDFRCVHLPSGEVAWIERGLAAGSVLIAADKLLVLDGTGELLVAEPSAKAFRPTARAHVLRGRCWTPPALAAGRLFVRNARGDVRCLRVGRLPAR